MNHTISPLSAMADAELRDLYASADETARRAVLDECARRDRRAGLERAREVNAQIYAEWRIAAHAQYLAAEQECRGELVNNAGERAVRDPFALWSMPGAAVDRFASDELKEFFLTSPRLTFGTYRRQRAADQRAAREDARSPITDMTDYESAWTTEGSRDEQHTAERAAVDGPAQAGHGRVGAADTVRPDRSGQQRPGAEAGQVRYAGSVQPGPRVMAVSAPVAPGHAEARAAGCKHPRTRFGTDAQCGDCPARRLGQAPARPVGTVAVLDGQVVDRRPSAPARAARSVDGALVLDLVRRYLAHYVSFPSDAALNTAVAWVAHAVARDRDDKGIGQLIWRASPRLLVTSRNRGSGKSTLLDLIVILTKSRNGKIPKITPRAIAETTGQQFETVVLDEAKTLFGSGAKNLELQGVLLAGYTPRTSYRIKGKSIPLFGAVAYAGKDELITDTGGGQIGDLLDRSITLRFRAAAVMPPEVDEIAEDDGDMLASALIAWTDSVRAELRQAARDIAAEDREASEAAEPGTGGNLRSVQIWRPLRAIARVAGGGWPADIDHASWELTAGAAGSEAEDALAELQRRAEAWGAVPADDEAGEIVTGPGGGEDDDWDEYEDGGDEEAPLTPPPPVYEPPVTYRAFVAVQGHGTRPLVCDVTDPAFARAVCESTAEARALGRPLRWVQSADGTAWTATGETDAVAWAVAAE